MFSTGAVLDSGRVAGRVKWTPGRPTAGRGPGLVVPRQLASLGVDAELRIRSGRCPTTWGWSTTVVGLTLGTCPTGTLPCWRWTTLQWNYRVDAGRRSVGSAVDFPVRRFFGRQTPLLRLDALPVQAATYLSGMRLDSSGDWRPGGCGWNDCRRTGWVATGRDDAFLVGPDTAVVPQQVEDSLWVGMAGTFGPSRRWRRKRGGSCTPW